MLTLRTGWDEREVEIIAISDQRRGAPEAALLYRETDASIAKRQQNAADRKALGAAAGVLRSERPNKKQRRQIHRFREQQD